ncbi:uncharacterized protein LOC122380588 [Amphibalanus amphitrite]|uniref:uncharacterized protein LOC122380588 n=1 Tax=Amphibalanus amphitrite TaxID=1232801 RepID=UPI001C8FF8D3|nr:uncharacterized protein LOC122380588 [Amphibalanus amphitrite]
MVVGGAALALLLAAAASLACLEIPDYRGSPSDTEAFARWTLDSSTGGGGGSCRCCGLCNGRTECSALSYRPDTRQCLLFSKVASYSNFERSFEQGGPKYFIMPGRSERDQFCRQSSDCTDSTLSCIGHICTDDPTITCRDVLTLRGGDAPLEGFHWGAITGRTLPLNCALDGFTLLMKASAYGLTWSSDNWKSHSHPPADPRHEFQHEAYSIMAEAELIRDSAAEKHFQIMLRGWYSDSMGGGYFEGLNMTLERSTPLLATSPPDPALVLEIQALGEKSSINGTQQVCHQNKCQWTVHGVLTVPYQHGPVYLLTTNTNPYIESDTGPFHDYGTLINAYGDLRWMFFSFVYNHQPDYVQYHIGE